MCRPPRLREAVDDKREFRQRRVIGERDQVQLDPDRVMDPGCNHGCHQRVATKREEVIVPADIAEFEDLRPDAGEQRFGFRLRLLTKLWLTWRTIVLPKLLRDQSCRLA